MMGTSITPAHFERDIIGSLLTDNDARDYCIGKLKPDDIQDSKCRSIFLSVLSLMEKREPVNIVSVSMLGHDMAELCELTTGIIPGTFRTCITALLTETAKRKALAAAQNLIQKLGSTKYTNPDEVVDDLNGLSVIMPQATGKAKTLSEIMAELPAELKRESQGKNLKYGIRDLDGLTGGLWPAELTIIAAGPGSGKTSISLNIAENTAKQGAKVLFISLEMNPIQLGKRFFQMAGIDGEKMRRPQELTPDDFSKMPEISSELGKLNITFDAIKTIQELQGRCTRLRERGEIDLLIIDYLGLLRSATKTESRRHEVEYITRSLKLLALELNMPIIALSQLNREGQKSTGPSLNDLRESGSIEQDADSVIFLHDANPKENLSALWLDLNVLIAKQRSGRTGKVTLRFDKRYQKFYTKER